MKKADKSSSAGTADESSINADVSSVCQPIAKPNVVRSASLHESINKLIPFISEDFITYPLREEGKYIPFLKCWQKADTENKCTRLSNRLNKLFEKTGYEISFIDKEHRSVIHEFYVYPKFKELKNGSYKFSKKDWSIEEMIELLGAALR